MMMIKKRKKHDRRQTIMLQEAVNFIFCILEKEGEKVNGKYINGFNRGI